MPSDSELLFALLAVRLGFVGREALKTPETAEDALAPAARAAVQAAVAAHIAQAKGDTAKALAVVSALS